MEVRKVKDGLVRENERENKLIETETDRNEMEWTHLGL